MCEEHINYFTPKGLNILLQKAGFNILYTTVTFPLEMFILMGEDYIQYPKIGPIQHNKRVLFEKNLSMSKQGKMLKEKMYEKFYELGIGRTLVVYAQKKK